jgi:hypothetical protein
MYYWAKVLIVSGFLSLTMTGGGSADERHSYKPSNGMVPDRATAIRIAAAVLAAIYGEQKIKSEYPFEARLDQGVWTIEGSLPSGMKGGVALIEILKDSGCILRVTHGK